MIQPWQDSMIVATARITKVQPLQSEGMTWVAPIVWVLVAGALVRLCWLGAGLLQLTRYRRHATTLHPDIAPVLEARRLTGTNARFCISTDVSGPSTMGWIAPVVLLPPSFLSLDGDAQRGIACHELLHVRRRDWLVTLIEEAAGAVLWFNPGIWWLLAQAKLTREQLVDAEVVRLTATEPYIKALLSMAVVSRHRWALPAASFFTRGHLIRRMRLLLADSRRSVFRLSLSYVAIGCLLAVAVGSAFAWLPLGNEAHVFMAQAPPAGMMRLALGQIEPAMLPVPGPALFNIRVPGPEQPVDDIRYFVHVTAPIASGEIGDVLSYVPPPPPPPPPPAMPPRFGFLEARGIRMVRPGEVASREEVQQLMDALKDRVVIDIQQAEDGTVQRVTVEARRLSNEANSVRARIPSASTEPAGPADPDRID
jgi:beta-lactamase regulating signal transducer with metallopeptidase domain